MSGEIPQLGWTVQQWRSAAISGFGEGALSAWLEKLVERDPAWIFLAPPEMILSEYSALSRRVSDSSLAPEDLPLYGVPFAVKDNIDVAGWPTTAACPAFRYNAELDATVVALIKAAGGIVVGKTNLDQFATGLVGTRTPYGVVPSAFHEEYIAGGSSSGSASLVTRGLLPFTLGTDTAGSGRVPAAFGNIVGLKPSRGAFSTRGVVPACRTLDCVSVFAQTVSDASVVAQVIRKFDTEDPYSRAFSSHARGPVRERKRLGVLAPLQFFGDKQAERAFAESQSVLRNEGHDFVSVDSAPFFELAALLYAGPWVVERSLTAGTLLDGPPELMDPVVRGLLEAAQGQTAAMAFQAEYRRAQLSAEIRKAFVGLDAIVVPTTPTTYRIQEVVENPLETNARLGLYTNFTNLADLCAVAVPGRFRKDGLPSGITFLGPAFSDLRLAVLADRAHRAMGVPLGSTGRWFASINEALGPEFSEKADVVSVAVVGAHLSGMPLNYQLVERGAHLRSVTRTASCYRLFLLPGTVPPKPGLLRVDAGCSIALEVWDMSCEAFGEFVAEVPPPLGIGAVQLEDESWVKGFICEPCGFEGALDISAHGGFRAYLEHRAESAG